MKPHHIISPLNTRDNIHWRVCQKVAAKDPLIKYTVSMDYLIFFVGHDDTIYWPSASGLYNGGYSPDEVFIHPTISSVRKWINEQQKLPRNYKRFV